ncbi:DUF4258 domain-containing protein [Robiginitalea sp. M366]|uniref:DUF4258 domain-containing protein n=1 Tax=Robiginitalea aestuariiviva TaxID=3036903 RepID=UPI00240D45C4|nr:DUF4258 domain-containing protein [Robiginitalea aestuariiviva]MDG1572985.1 DUF4258 domain-containing protein [Robiginitalea aestuariiviva]
MGFLKRFGWYLIGLSIGLIFLAVFLRKKSEETGVEFCYLPNCRVLKDLRSKPLEKGAALQVPTDSLAVAYLLKHGEVLFGQSTPRKEPCGVYVVEGQYQEQALRLTLENCDSVCRLLEYRPLPE